MDIFSCPEIIKEKKNRALERHRGANQWHPIENKTGRDGQKPTAP